MIPSGLWITAEGYGNGQSQKRRLIREQAGESRVALDSSVLPFKHVGGPQSPAMAGGEGEYGQTVGPIILHPSGKFVGLITGRLRCSRIG
jgi:hypothetical protein